MMCDSNMDSVCYVTDEDEDNDEDHDGDDEDDWTLNQTHGVPFSSESDAQGGDSWRCSPPSTSPSGETPPSQPGSGPESRPGSRPESRPGSRPGSRPESRPRSRPASQSPSPPSPLTGTKKRNSKPAHMRRNIRKLLRDHQLESGTKAAQQDELQRRRRLEQSKNFPVPSAGDDVTKRVSSSASQQEVRSLRQEVKSLRQEVVCLDSSSASISEDEVKTSVASEASTQHTHKTVVIDVSSGEDDSVLHAVEEDEDGESSDALSSDSVNRPDALGRVLVNLNHPAPERDVFLSPQLARAVKPHQIGGIRFLYDNLVESVQRFGSSSGFGCILAHSMGLGKTLQVISFIDVLFRHTEAHTVLAIVPVNTLQNWLSEFNHWVPPPEALPQETHPDLVTPRAFKVHILNDEHKNTASRAKVVEAWTRDGGVLLMGYEMYRLLSMKKSFSSGRKKKSKKTAVIDLDEEDKQQELLRGVERALSRPGPDVVICDEGHRIKNVHASTSQALKNIRTKRRVVLTGFPLQNNLIEYWCMVDFVRPDFLGTRQEFSNMFERPILNGQCVDSTPQDVQLMRYRSHVLHSLLEGFVQRRGHDVLKDQLPPKQEHVILVRLSPLQRTLYTEFMNRFRDAGNSGWLSLNPLKAFCVCCKIWNHPDVLFEALQKENLAGDQDLDLDDITSSGPAPRPPPANQKAKSLEGPPPIGGFSLTQLQEKANQVITYEWAKDILVDYRVGVLENSAKMVLLFHLIDESVRKGDKILVFSQSLSTLSVIEDFLSKRPVPPPPGSRHTHNQNHNQTWVRNHNYYRLDGSTTASERERLINQFNSPSNTNTWLFLLSTRAGCLGVNLVGANRVVVFDASWNPCHDAQAVCRVYRYGQRKACHIYRLVCDFTLEKKIYDRQISKQGMSDRVVDDLNPVLTFTRREVESLLHFVEEEPDPDQVQLQAHEGLEGVLRKALLRYPRHITKQPFTHESLLLDRRELKLSKTEKKAAKKSYEEEKRASVPYTRPSYAHYYPASDQSLTNIPAFSQRNWRPPPRPEDQPVSSPRPVQSTPVPMIPRQAGGSTSDQSASSIGAFPVNCLQKAGVFVQKIVTTTDIVIPGTNSSTDVQARITAGESIHIIRGTKGTYIRSSDGRIFAIRAANKTKSSEETSASPKDPQVLPEEASTNGSARCVSPDRKQPVPRPLSPDSPEIISELQCYTESAPPPGPAPPGPPPSRRDAMTVIQNPEAAANQEPRKRKASTPSLEERPGKQQHVAAPPNAPPSAAAGTQSFPYSGGYGLRPLGLSPALLGGALGHRMFSPYYQPRDSGYYDVFGFPPPSSTTPCSSSSSSTSSSSSAPGALPPFMLSPSMGGLLPPLSYGQSLASLYTGSMLPGGLPGPAATPGPAGSSFLSQFPPNTNNTSSSSMTPPLQGRREAVMTNGGNISSSDSDDEGDDDDDDVIEIRRQ